MSCLYRSLAHFLPGVSPNQLRQTICDYLRQDPDLLDNLKASQTIPWETGMDLNTYISRMRYQNEWGGAIEIKLYCDLFKRNVIVKSLPNGKDIEFFSKTPSNVWNKIYWTGNHYEPMKEFVKGKNNIKIHRAWYGSLHHNKLRINVTPIIRNLFKNNNLEFKNLRPGSYNQAFGNPCPNLNKVLVIKLYFNGEDQIHTLKFREDSDISLAGI